MDFKESGISPLSELRVICAFFRGEQVKAIHNTKSLVEALVEHEGFRKWICIDGNSIRFRVYKNGSMHIDVHLISPSGLTIFYQLSYRWHYLPTVWLIAEIFGGIPCT